MTVFKLGQQLGAMKPALKLVRAGRRDIFKQLKVLLGY